MKLIVVLLLLCPLVWAKGNSNWDSIDGPATRATKSNKKSDVKFLLYTSSNPNTPLLLSTNNTSVLALSDFDQRYPTLFIIHGWLNSCEAGPNTIIRPLLLELGRFNIICVDWSSRASNPNYVEASNDVPAVGQEVAEIIDFLNDAADMSFNSLVLFGEGLGAQVSGFAGKYVSRGRVNLIIGEDPAAPLFNFKPCDERLCESDGLKVIALHTTPLFLSKEKQIQFP